MDVVEVLNSSNQYLIPSYKVHSLLITNTEPNKDPNNSPINLIHHRNLMSLLNVVLLIDTNRIYPNDALSVYVSKSPQ